MYTNIDMKNKKVHVGDDSFVAGTEQINMLRLEIAYWMGKGEFNCGLHDCFNELLLDYEVLINKIKELNTEK